MMRIKIFGLIILVILCLNISCSSQIGEIGHLDIEFDGGKKEFYGKYNLWNNINDLKQIQQIVEMIDTAKLLITCESRKPVMWEIDVIAVDNLKNTEHLFKIGSNTFNKFSLWKDGRCYENDTLIQIMVDYMKVEQIRIFEGRMTQEEYELILKDN